jgi:hypothetical protein
MQLWCHSQRTLVGPMGYVLRAARPRKTRSASRDQRNTVPLFERCGRMESPVLYNLFI